MKPGDTMWVDPDGTENIYGGVIDFGGWEDPRHPFEATVRRFAGTAPNDDTHCWCGGVAEAPIHRVSRDAADRMGRAIG